jgi:hypothetical protein
MKAHSVASCSWRALPVIAIGLLSWLSCSKTPEPRSVVVDFLRSIREDTTSSGYLRTLLDLDELLTEGSVYQYDSSMSHEDNATRFLNLFLAGGRVRAMWVKNQIVVGNMNVSGDTAIIEVSFIDREAAPVKQYYNKMGVHRIEGHWKLFAFKLF